MDVKTAVRTAKDYVADLFSDDRPSEISLEEIERDETRGCWNVTISFSRTVTVDERGMLKRPMEGRQYKVVAVDDGGQVKSVKQRIFEAH